MNIVVSPFLLSVVLSFLYIGTAEIEGILNEADEVSESAVIGFPHQLKGEGIGCFVVLKDSIKPTEELTKYICFINSYLFLY
jgi:acyl-coenzyme A synthetase/AMP-(fatty) acid ligase